MVEVEKRRTPLKVKKASISKVKQLKKPKVAEVILPAKAKKSTCSVHKEQTPIAIKSEPERLQEQFDKYSSLPYRKTYRGIAFYMTLFIAIITTLSAVLGERLDILYGLSFIIPLLYLIQKSYRWVYIIAILWWSSEKTLQIMESSHLSMVVSAILWWFVICYIYYRAFRVESLRVKEADKIGISPQKRKYIKDIVISVILFFFVTFCIAFLSV